MNFQNIPRKDKVVKTAFVPKLDALLLCDYKQIEPRLLAFYLSTTPAVSDDSLAAYIRSGVDPYSAIVTQFLGREDFTEEERQDAKIVFLSQMYGGGAGPVKDAFGCSWKEATKITNQFHAAWPGIGLLRNAIAARMKERGYITTLWGRHLHPTSEHKYINALIQGCAADLMKAAAIRVHKWVTAEGLTSHLLNLVHDELILDAVLSELGRLAETVPQLMDYPPVSTVVPIGVDVEVAWTNWAEKEPYAESEGAAGAPEAALQAA